MKKIDFKSILIPQTVFETATSRLEVECSIQLSYWGKGWFYNRLNLITPDETRTRNLLVRSQAPYPLGHGSLF